MKVKAKVKSQGRVRPGKRNVNAWISEELGHALATYLEGTRPQPTVTSVLEVALEDFLRARGCQVKSR